MTSVQKTLKWTEENLWEINKLEQDTKFLQETMFLKLDIMTPKSLSNGNL